MAPRHRRRDNLPDDWAYYYRRCSLCGSTYHESEGGCGCDDLDDDDRQRMRDAAADAAADYWYDWEVEQ